jgi:hypothetical protein
LSHVAKTDETNTNHVIALNDSGFLWASVVVLLRRNKRQFYASTPAAFPGSGAISTIAPHVGLC